MMKSIVLMAVLFYSASLGFDLNFNPESESSRYIIILIKPWLIFTLKKNIFIRVMEFSEKPILSSKREFHFYIIGTLTRF